MEKVKLYDSGAKAKVKKAVKLSSLPFHIPLFMKKLKKATTVSILHFHFPQIVKKIDESSQSKLFNFVSPSPNSTPLVFR